MINLIPPVTTLAKGIAAFTAGVLGTVVVEKAIRKVQDHAPELEVK